MFEATSALISGAPKPEDAALSEATWRARLTMAARRAEPATEAAREDAADLVCVFARALSEGAADDGGLLDRLGLERAAFDALTARCFPGMRWPAFADRSEPPADQTALAMLIRWRGAPTRPESLAFADVIARRSMAPSHLWESLGLPERPRLRRLIARHFPRLIELNSANMRWKKFFYRQICSDAAFSLCLSPSCDECPEKAECFVQEEDARPAS